MSDKEADHQREPMRASRRRADRIDTAAFVIVVLGFILAACAIAAAFLWVAIYVGTYFARWI